METHPLTAKNWLIVAWVALAIGLFFVLPYLGVIALAALMAFLFHGVYVKLNAKMRAGGAATLTFLFSLLVVLVPVILIGIFTILQLGRLVTDITSTFGGDYSSIPAALQGVIASINTIAAPVVGNEHLITSEGVVAFLQATIPVILQNLTAFLAGVIGGFPLAVIYSIMYIFLFYEFLVFGKKIVSSIVSLSPFQPEVTRMYLARVGLMANAMAKGQLVIAFIVAVLSALTLGFFLNMWEYFFLMTVVFTLLNLIPLGAGIVIYPIIIIAMLMGAVWPGVGAFIVYSAISNLDSVLRPKFIPKSITLTNGLTMLAAFGGIALYGVIGVVYGPIIMIIVVTSVQMYLDYYQDMPRWKKKANKG